MWILLPCMNLYIFPLVRDLTQKMGLYLFLILTNESAQFLQLHSYWSISHFNDFVMSYMNKMIYDVKSAHMFIVSKNEIPDRISTIILKIFQKIKFQFCKFSPYFQSKNGVVFTKNRKIETRSPHYIKFFQ